MDVEGLGVKDDLRSARGTPTYAQVSRQLDRMEDRLFNRLASMEADGEQVKAILEKLRKPTAIANKRCGKWHLPPTMGAADCHFKSSDGHAHHWQFSSMRLNAHVLPLLESNAHGAAIVDATRSAKKAFPDSMTRTIPIWCAAMNAVIFGGNARDHLVTPPWITDMERSALEATAESAACGLLRQGDEGIEASKEGVTTLKEEGKPIRPMWIQAWKPPWAHSPPDLASLPFRPLLLISASDNEGERRRLGGRECMYLRGAGDDEENWSVFNLASSHFWRNKDFLLDGGEKGVEERVRSVMEDGQARHHEQTLDEVVWLGRSGIGLRDFGGQKGAEECAVAIKAEGEGEEEEVKVRIESQKRRNSGLKGSSEKLVDFVERKIRGKVNCVVEGSDFGNRSVCVAVLVLAALFDESREVGTLRRERLSCESITKQAAKPWAQYVCARYSKASPARALLKQIWR